jgi:hypothetical protein
MKSSFTNQNKPFVFQANYSYKILGSLTRDFRLQVLFMDQFRFYRILYAFQNLGQWWPRFWNSSKWGPIHPCWNRNCLVRSLNSELNRSMDMGLGEEPKFAQTFFKKFHEKNVHKLLPEDCMVKNVHNFSPKDFVVKNVHKICQKISWGKCAQILPKDFMGEMFKSFAKRFHGKNVHKFCQKISWEKYSQIFSKKFHEKNLPTFLSKNPWRKTTMQCAYSLNP